MNATETKHTPAECLRYHPELAALVQALRSDNFGDAAKKARLIVAAPDLLAACKTALAYLDANRPKGNVRDNFSALNSHENRACKPLRAAIAKAEGGAA